MITFIRNSRPDNTILRWKKEIRIVVAFGKGRWEKLLTVKGHEEVFWGEGHVLYVEGIWVIQVYDCFKTQPMYSKGFCTS